MHLAAVCWTAECWPAAVAGHAKPAVAAVPPGAVAVPTARPGLSATMYNEDEEIGMVGEATHDRMLRLRRNCRGRRLGVTCVIWIAEPEQEIDCAFLVALHRF